MPRRRFRRRRFKRRRGRRYPVVKMVRKLVRHTDMELKDSHLTSNGTVTSAGVVILINGIAEGIGPTQRIGREIKLVSLLFNYTVINNVNNQIGAVMRVMIVLDKEPVPGTPLIAANVLQDVSGAPWGVLSGLHRDGFKRFRVLMDRRHTLIFRGPGTLTNRSVFKRLNFRNRYRGADATQVSIATGALYLLFISNVNANIPDFFATARLRWAG